MIDVTPTSSCTSPSAQHVGRALKYGSYCLTGLPLLLKTVLPLTIQRCGPPVTSGSARLRFINTDPEPSEHSNAICSRLSAVGSVRRLRATSAACSSRVMVQLPAGRVAHIVAPETSTLS